MVNEALQLWVFVCNNDTYFNTSLYEQFNHPSMTEDQTEPLAFAVAI